MPQMIRNKNNRNRVLLSLFGGAVVALCLISIHTINNPPHNQEFGYLQLLPQPTQEVQHMKMKLTNQSAEQLKQQTVIQQPVTEKEEFLQASKHNEQDLVKLKEKDEKLKEKEGLIQQLTNKIACLTKGVLPTGGFCLEKSETFQGGNYVWDGKVCATLETIFGHSSVGDFGAGLGHYGSCFLRSGGSIIKTTNKVQESSLQERYEKEMKNSQLDGKPQVIKSWEGYDGAFNVESVSNGKIHTLDLSVPFQLDHKFDWILSLEVGEHIPQEKEQVFLDNIVNHACKGVVLSWAVLGQGGYKHVNNRNNDYVKGQMGIRGLIMDDEATDTLRRAAVVSWFKNTLMVYRFPKPKC